MATVLAKGQVPHIPTEREIEQEHSRRERLSKTVAADAKRTLSASEKIRYQQLKDQLAIKREQEKAMHKPADPIEIRQLSSLFPKIHDLITYIMKPADMTYDECSQQLINDDLYLSSMQDAMNTYGLTAIRKAPTTLKLAASLTGKYFEMRRVQPSIKNSHATTGSDGASAGVISEEEAPADTDHHRPSA